MRADRASFITKPILIETGLQTSRGPEIRNAAENALSAKAEEDLRREAAGCKDQTKRALPTTVTPERSHAKILHNDSKQITVGKPSSRKALISLNFSRRNPSNSQNTEFYQR